MPQYIPQQGIDPVLGQMQAQLAQQQSGGLERARLNAGQYMKDFRQDAQNAGYSLGEWAKRNEQNVKSALFSLSGSNQNVTEQKYQELVNAPESFDQKQQRLEDKLSAGFSETLVGTPDTIKTITTTEGADEGREGTTVDYAQSMVLATENNIDNMLVLGAKMLGYDDFRDMTPEDKELNKLWRKEVAKSVGFRPGGKEFTGEEQQNVDLFNIYKAGPTTTMQTKTAGSSFELDPNRRQIFHMVHNAMKERGGPAAGGGNVEQILADPVLKAEARKEAERLIDAGDFRAVEGSFSSYSAENWEELFRTEAHESEMKAGEFPSLSFGGREAVEGTTTTTREVISKGEESFLDQKEKYFKALSGRGVSQASITQMENEFRAADTTDSKNKAQSDLYSAQAALTWAQIDAVNRPPGPTTDRYFDLYETKLNDLQKIYLPEDLLKIKYQSPEYYLYISKLTDIINTGKSAGMYTDATPLSDNEIELKADGWFKAKGYLPSLIDVGPQFTQGTTDLAGVKANIQGFINKE